ncbi:MAG TPA: hydrogenase [Thermoplasmata archaeon]|nr:hydrogenase [Thermoplasmata archaeon]
MDPFIPIDTGSGFWNPLVWVVTFVIALLIIYVIRGFGRKDYKENTGQTRPFLSGNVMEKSEQLHVKGDNVYWGFTEAFKGYYNKMKKLHTGDTRDYVLWFLVTMVVFFVVVFGVM